MLNNQYELVNTHRFSSHLSRMRIRKIPVNYFVWHTVSNCYIYVVQISIFSMQLYFKKKMFKYVFKNEIMHLLKPAVYFATKSKESFVLLVYQ